MCIGKCEYFEEKIESKSTDGWHDPVDNPQICLYSQGGASKKPWHGSYGKTIRDGTNAHGGIDLFSLVGSPVYACVDGVVTSSTVSNTNDIGGQMIFISVSNNQYFIDNYNKDFLPKYKNKGELTEANFKVEEQLELVYLHLSKRYVKKNQEVKAGDLIGLSGISGSFGNDLKTANPHLHFEIRNKGKRNGKTDRKCNPLMYVKVKYENELSQQEIDIQETARLKHYNPNKK